MCTYIHFVSQVNIYVYIFIVHEQYVYSMYIHVPDNISITHTSYYIMQLYVYIIYMHVPCDTTGILVYYTYSSVCYVYTIHCILHDSRYIHSRVCLCTVHLYTGTLSSVFCMTVYI